MKKALIASLATSALVIGAFAMSASAYVFSNYLSVGSTGNDVVALQSFLVSKGFLTMPAHVDEGYFGSLTKAAVVAYQASVSLPSTGYVGPMTIKVLNAGGTTTASTGAATCPAGYSCAQTTPVTFACPSGWTCTPLAGTTGGTVTGASTATGITTPGVQGIMSVTAGPISQSVAYAGQTKVPVLDARIQAQFSDLSVQSVQVDLGTSTAGFNYVYNTIYLINPTTGAVLASEPLNNSTVVQNGSDYIVSLTGFNFIVPKGTFQDLQIAVDFNSTILSGSPNYLGTRIFSIAPSGIRSVDGAGVNQYGPGLASGGATTNNPTGGIAQSIVVQQNQSLSASANISLDGSNLSAGAVGVTNVSSGSYLGLPVLTFDVNAQGDTLHLHNVQVNFSTTGSTGSGQLGAVYLYNGSTIVMSAATTCTGTNCSATFTNIPDGTSAALIPINTSVAFTVKVDVTGPANTNFAENVTASTSVSGTTIYGSTDNGIIPNGVAQGNQQTVEGEGAVFALVGTPTMSTPVQQNTSSTTAPISFKYTANFNVQVTAIGESVTLGLPSALSGAAFGSTTTGTSIAQIYESYTPVTGNSNARVSGLTGGYSQPTNTSLTVDNNYFSLGINQSATIPVTYSFIVSNPGSNTYAVQINGINWFTSEGLGTSTAAFMLGQTAWRTPSL
jgi:hypothetical protein